ncbi:MAG: endopeptidase La [Gemmatimonadetes bacterium]|nr:MAG: endopeptidase La [Gemmatimonadota bacterium]
MQHIPDRLPILPLRDIVIFPNMVMPLLVGRDSSVLALEKVMENEDPRLILLVTQKNSEVMNPSRVDMYRIGTVAKVVQILRLPDGTLKVLIEGIKRARIQRFLPHPEYLMARIELIEDTPPSPSDKRVSALLRSAMGQFVQYVKLNPRIPDEILISVGNLHDANHLVNLISAYTAIGVAEKQKILEMNDISEQLESLMLALSKEIEILELEKQIEDEVRDRMQKSQKEFYLQEQLKVINRELGREDGYEEVADEVNELRQAIQNAKMSPEAEEKALKELDKFKKTPPMSPESTVIRNYLDWLISMPWAIRTPDNLDLERAETILNEDHYGLEKVKERILEYLAVLKLVDHMKGPILCLVGPPGVGKTSLGRSIARALGREFVRISLGGVRDEAEIRGHRRTYIGSMPGRIIQSLKRAGSKNPVFLLDEVDKMGADFRGDPTSALLEVLDPEQNKTFNDHYLDVDFDLSEVMFITTANSLYGIPLPLQDRMEIIRLPGYLDHEKIAIAKHFLIPKQLKEHGLSEKVLTFSDKAIHQLIHAYTREAGVRNLEREIAHICRKTARKVAGKKRSKRYRIQPNNLEQYLGVPKFLEADVDKVDRVGAATGLAWTEVGGDVLTIEVVVLKGKGNLVLTGKLGEVMQESAKAAVSYVRSRAEFLKIDPNFHETTDLHIHIPEGAVPKDGPSAGITITTALVSALTNIPVRHDIAMTGEMTLRGHVLPIGGLNEKLVAALRSDLKTVIIPKRNEKDLKEIPAMIRKRLIIHLASTADEVLNIALATDAEQVFPLATTEVNDRELLHENTGRYAH